MELQEIFDALYEGNQTNILRFKSNEIETQCMFCGDSKTVTHGHMYIGVSDGVPLYYCQRCNVKGVVNNSFLQLYEVPISLATNIILQTPKNRQKHDKNKERKLNVVLSLPETRCTNYDNKMYYFENRTGLNAILSFELYNIIYSFDTFLNQNKTILKDFEINYHFRKNLDENYIGMLTSNRESIIFRLVNDSLEDNYHRRYYHIQLIKNNNVKFYTPTELIESSDVEVNFCEGIFDCINLREKYKKRNNQLFVAVLNKDYSTKVDFMIDKFGIKLDKFKFYLDDDVKYYKQFYPLLSISEIYKNSIGNDYGEVGKFRTKSIKKEIILDKEKRKRY